MKWQCTTQRFHIFAAGVLFWLKLDGNTGGDVVSTGVTKYRPISRPSSSPSTRLNSPKIEGCVIRIGILLAQNISIGKQKGKDDEVAVSTWKSGDFYASAFVIAIDEINNNPDLLPRHKLEYVYNNTECLDKKAMKLFHYQVCQRDVVGVIGLGCTRCNFLAEYAGAANIMMVSHVS